MYEEMKTFVAVVEEKSFTKAAKRVAFSQPTVSQHVKRIELFFGGTELFERSGTGNSLVLTVAGQLAYKAGKEIIAIAEKTKEEIDQQSAFSLKGLRIGASKNAGNYLMPIAISRFSSLRQKTPLSITIGSTKSICTLLEQGRIDLGLIEGRETYYSFIRENFYIDKMILVTAPALIKKIPDFTAASLNRLTWIVREKGSGTRKDQLEFFAAKYIHPAHQIVCNSTSANIELACQGTGITLLSALSVRDELEAGRLIKIPIGKEINRVYSYVIKEETAAKQDPAIKDLIRVLRNLI